MASPLIKRVPRELKGNLGKYLGILLMMILSISFVTGYLAAATSIQKIMDGTRDTYNIEDARFTAHYQLKDKVINKLESTDKDDEDKLTCKVLDDFYYDLSAQVGGATHTWRLYSTQEREAVNKAVYYEGRAPHGADEVALDKVYCSNNGLHTGDVIDVNGKQMTIVGILVLSDHQALFEDNSSFVFNAISFSVGLADDAAFEAFAASGLTPAYVYSITFDDRALSQTDRVEQEYRLENILANKDIGFDDFLDSTANQSIGYAAEDVEGDQTMWIVLMMLLILIMAFVFVVLNNAYIEQESASIGTLLSLGYSNGELVRHYMALPIIIGIIAAVVGNLLGYIAFADPMSALYYNSYSLPPYVASFNPGVFVFATLVPLILLWGVSLWGLKRKMGHTPLQFLRHEIGREGGRRQVQLSHKLSFISRFRIRVFMRNLGSYITLFCGICFASMLLIFGLCMLPTMNQYADHLKDDLVAEHTYTLNEPLELTGTSAQREAYAAKHELETTAASSMSKKHRAELKKKSDRVKKTENAVNTQTNSNRAIEQAEKFACISLQSLRAIGGNYEDVTVYGIQQDSKYWTDIDVGENAVVLGRGVVQKCGATMGKMFTLENEFTGWKYDVKPVSETGSTSCMNIYMSIEHFNSLFTQDDDYFNGYASNEPLQLDSWILASDLTPADMNSIGEQMENSMSKVMGMFTGLAAAIYVVLMYLLTKNAIDGAARNISYMKVFGYRNREINKIYLSSITYTVLASLVLSLPAVIASIIGLLKLAFMFYSGNLDAYIPLYTVAEVLLCGIVCYGVVAIFHVRRIKRVPMALALKVTE